MQVFFYEAFAEEEAAIRSFLPDSITAGFSAGTIAETGHSEPPAGLISIRTQSSVPDAWEGSIQAVLSRSTGYDHLQALVQRFSASPPAVGYLPLYCHTAVAEHALMAMLALARRLPRQLEQFQRFERDHLTGIELTGRTVAVFGVGNIGLEVTRLCAGFGMQVLGVDVSPIDPLHPLHPVTWVEPDEALERADVVVCAMDLNAGNRGYFGAAQVAAMRPGCLFVNVSRGELSPPTVLLAALERGHLGGVALDVYDAEPTLAEPLRAGETPTHPEAVAAVALSRRHDAICTPHNAFNSDEAVQRKSEHSVLQVGAWLDTGCFRWPAPVAKRGGVG